MTYTIEMSTKFKKDFKLIEKRGYDISLIKNVIGMLANAEQLPEEYKDHALKGEYISYRECHIQPDWLLIYRIEKDKLVQH